MIIERIDADKEGADCEGVEVICRESADGKR
jgi:hypothetical protein